MRWAGWHRACCAAAVVVGVLLVGCEGDAPSLGPADSAEPAADTAAPSDLGPPEPDGGAPTPRPAERRYYLANAGGRCHTYAEQAGRRSPVRIARCPRDLFSGERIRLAGRTCLRESSQPGRNLPVHCPPDILAAEQAAHIDAGAG